MLQHRFTLGLCVVCILGVACSSNAAVVQGVETDKAPAGPIADTAYTPTFASGGPSSSDVLEGKLPYLTNGNLTRESALGPAALTNGSVSTYYGDGLSEDIHSTYLSGGNGDSVTYSLGGVYDLSSIVIYGGWGDGGRDQQKYDLEVSADGINFTTLASVDENPGIFQTDVTPISTRISFTEDTSSFLAEDVTTVRLSFLDSENLWTGYSEIDVFGTTSTVFGDADGNGLVNAADFAAISSNFKTVPSTIGMDGDANYDNFVDENDLFEWRAAVGAAAISVEQFGSSIPEPASLLLVGVGSVLAWGIVAVRKQK